MGYSSLGRNPCRLRTKMIKSILLNNETGACAYGISEIGEMPSKVMEAYQTWLDKGNAAGMDYLANHLPLRRDPGLLLPGTRSVISLAFPYSPREWRADSLPAIASYAYGADYHDVLRKRLRGAAERLCELYGGEYRICIDSAPVFERYWAEKCGLGRRADNGLISVGGYGTRVFLAEILSTTELPKERGCLTPQTGRYMNPATDNSYCDKPQNRIQSGISGNTPESCIHCGACRRACPAGALKGDSTVDARLCLSYLTIEHRGEWNEEGQKAMNTPAGRRTLFGCDICQNVCPMNAPVNPSIPPTGIEEFSPSEIIMTMTAEQARNMTQQEFTRDFKGSAIKRTKLAGFLRNAGNLRKPAEASAPTGCV